jgi:predicted anti-sigma-YlaC factor YlaD
MKSIFDWLRKHFTKWYQPDAEMVKMLQALAKTEEQEISCDDVFAVLDEFAEAVRRGENVLLFMPLVRQHLDMCPDCREEYEALLRMLQPEFA